MAASKDLQLRSVLTRIPSCRAQTLVTSFGLRPCSPEVALSQKLSNPKEAGAPFHAGIGQSLLWSPPYMAQWSGMLPSNLCPSLFHGGSYIYGGMTTPPEFSIFTCTGISPHKILAVLGYVILSASQIKNRIAQWVPESGSRKEVAK